jgi:superfamily I DNA/RNA helicase
VTVSPYRAVADELHQLAFGRRAVVASDEQVRDAVAKTIEAVGANGFTPRFLLSEWIHVVDAWQIPDVESYAKVPRLGRKNRMSAGQRERLWPVFAAVRASLAKRGLATWPDIFGRTAAHYASRTDKPFTHIVVDEAQDLGVAEFRFLSAIAPLSADALFFAGDLGQRIFQQPFSWKELGVDVRGRSSTLTVNYRTSHQIRRVADRLLPSSVRDVDGNADERDRTVSVFNGPPPEVQQFDNPEAEIAGVAAWITSRITEGTLPSEIGLFVRSRVELPRARSAAEAAGQTWLESSEHDQNAAGKILIGTMHLAKGLEFKAVVIMACDDGILPLQSRLEAVADETELDDVYETERHLFYVACTRARDRLLISATRPVSEYIEDLQPGQS